MKNNNIFDLLHYQYMFLKNLILHQHSDPSQYEGYTIGILNTPVSVLRKCVNITVSKYIIHVYNLDDLLYVQSVDGDVKCCLYGVGFMQDEYFTKPNIRYNVREYILGCNYHIDILNKYSSELTLYCNTKIPENLDQYKYISYIGLFDITQFKTLLSAKNWDEVKIHNISENDFQNIFSDIPKVKSVILTSMINCITILLRNPNITNIDCYYNVKYHKKTLRNNSTLLKFKPKNNEIYFKAKENKKNIVN